MELGGVLGDGLGSGGVAEDLREREMKDEKKSRFVPEASGRFLLVEGEHVQGM